MVSEDTKNMIIDGLYNGLHEAIHQCKPDFNSQPMQDKIETFFKPYILYRYMQLKYAIEDGKISEIQAIMKAPDYTSNIMIHGSFYLPLRMQEKIFLKNI